MTGPGNAQGPGASSGEDSGASSGEAAARERLDTLFASFDKLTPDELGRIGIGGWDDEAHEELLDELDAAARATGRVALVDEARARARDSVLRRYAQGTLHPTWVALNWGISQGTVEDRVAIVEVLSDAAAASVVADALDPDTLEALSLTAEHVVGMADGMVSEGSLGRQMEIPGDPELGTSSTRRVVIAIVAGIVTSGTVGSVASAVSGPVGAAASLLAGVVVALVAYRR